MKNTKNLTTLGKVWDRVDELNRYCHDNLIDVQDISFDSLETMKIGSDHHKLKSIAQRSISNRLGIPYPYLKKCPEDIQAMNLNHWIMKEKNLLTTPFMFAALPGR